MDGDFERISFESCACASRTLTDSTSLMGRASPVTGKYVKCYAAMMKVLEEGNKEIRTVYDHTITISRDIEASCSLLP